jgi:hypothetical protein
MPPGLGVLDAALEELELRELELTGGTLEASDEAMLELGQEALPVTPNGAGWLVQVLREIQL